MAHEPRIVEGDEAHNTTCMCCGNQPLDGICLCTAGKCRSTALLRIAALEARIEALEAQANHEPSGMDDYLARRRENEAVALERRISDLEWR